ALVDDVLGVTQEMGEADLLVFRGPAGLGAVAIGDPHLWANVAEELLDRLLGAAGMGQEEGVLTVMEDPQPPASLADPQAGLVRTDHGSLQQPGADVGAGGGEALARLAQDVDQRAFADEKAKQIAHQARQALESDALGEAQIDDQRPQVGAERRARLEPRRRLRLEAPGAAGTDASVQAHPRDLGGDRGNLDPVVDLARGLRALRNVGPAMPADIRQNVAPLRRVRMQRPMRARMRFLLAPALDELGRPLLSLARGNARVIRRLGRTIQLRPQPGDLGPKGDDRLRLPFDRL